MLLFPLGLKARTQRFPIATVIITFATVLLSIPHFGKLHRYQVAYVESIGDAYHARANLLVENCGQTKLASEDCEFLKKHLPKEKPRNFVFQFSDISDKAVEEFGKKKAKGKVEEYADYLLEDHRWLELAPQLDNNPAFVAYNEAKSRYEGEMLSAQSRFNLLSNGNLNLKSVMLAQWTHGGWMHLIGNMLFFVLLAIPVEQRLGSIAFAGIYLLGGTLGLGGQVFLYDSPVKFLIGASANVSAIAGAFFVLFFALQMRIWFSALFLYNRIVHIPTWIFVPSFIVLGDITGAVSPESGVAHVAHLFGFAVGTVGAFIHAKMYPLPRGYAFHFEHELSERAQQAAEPIEKLKALWELLFYNTDNQEARREAIDVVLSLNESEMGQLPPEAKRVLERHFDPIFRCYLEKEDKFDLISFVDGLPVSWPLAKLTRKLNPTYLRMAGQQAEQSGKLHTAIRLYQLYIHNVATEAAKQHVSEVIKNLEARMGHGTAA